MTIRRLIALSLALTLVGSVAMAAATLEVGPGKTYASISAAIAAPVADGDTILVYPGTYTDGWQLGNNVTDLSNVTIQGTDRDTVILQPHTTVDQNMKGEAALRAATFYLVNCPGVIIKDLTLDYSWIATNVANMTGGRCYGVAFCDSTNALVDNVIAKDFSVTDTGASNWRYGELCFVFYGTTAYNTANGLMPGTIQNSTVKDGGRIGVWSGQWNDTSVLNCTIYKTASMQDFGYGIELGRQSSGTIRGCTIWGYGIQAASDLSGSAGIYIHAHYTTGLTVTKNIVVEDNDISECMSGIWIGHYHWGGTVNTGDAEVNVELNGNNLHNNFDDGLTIQDSTQDGNGPSTVNVTGSGNTITDNGQNGIGVYTSDGGGSITLEMTQSTISGNNNAILVLDDTNPAGPDAFSVTITDSNLGGNFNGIDNEVPGLNVDADDNWWGEPGSVPPGYNTGAGSTTADNPTNNVVLDDTDGDGLKDFEEDILGTDKTKKDTDGDGFEDKVEVDAGTNPLDEFDFPTPGPGFPAPGDSDGDGYDDQYEFAQGTDWTNPNDHPTLGDVNGNGKVDNVDAVIIFQTQLGNLSIDDFITLLPKMDLNRDGQITIEDAIDAFDFFLNNLDVLPTA